MKSSGNLLEEIIDSQEVAMYKRANIECPPRRPIRPSKGKLVNGQGLCFPYGATADEGLWTLDHSMTLD